MNSCLRNIKCKKF